MSFNLEEKQSFFFQIESDYQYNKNYVFIILIMSLIECEFLNGKNMFRTFHFNNQMLKNYESCFNLVKYIKGFNILLFIPKKFRDYNMCFEAVKNDGLSLCYTYL
jgi:hypothetical protein